MERSFRRMKFVPLFQGRTLGTATLRVANHPPRRTERRGIGRITATLAAVGMCLGGGGGVIPGVIPILPGGGKAMAEDPPKLYRLVEIDVPTGVASAQGLGINCKGEVVGNTWTAGGVGYRAMLWLPSGAYGLGKGFHHLNATDEAWANSINDHGRIAGFAGNLPTTAPWTDTWLHLWDMQGHSSGPITGIDVHPIKPPNLLHGDRIAINHHDEMAASYDFGNGNRGFRIQWDESTGVGTPEILVPPVGMDFSSAYAINDSGLAAGARHWPQCHCPPPQLCGVPCPRPLPFEDGATWSPSMTEPLDLEAIVWWNGWLGCDEWLGPRARVPLGVNSANRIVGRAWSDPNDSCAIDAAIWVAPNASPLSLPHPDGHSVFDPMTANSISDPGLDGFVNVVGENIPLRHATLWRIEASKIDNQQVADWEALDLNEVTEMRGTIFEQAVDKWCCEQSPEDCAAGWCNVGPPGILREATAVNSLGWITGWGETSQSQVRAFVLVPLQGPNACPADLNADGVVNVFDLLDLLAAWGPCPPDNPCWADITGDGVVNVFDMLALLAAWDSCPGHCDPPEVGSLEDELAAVGITLNGWEDFLDVQQSGTALERERWRCWLERRLSRCVVCRTCRGTDPFDE